MTQTEALKLALRAMVVNNQAWKHLADSGDAGFWDAEEQGYYQLNEQAIKAVEAALEAKDEPVAWNEGVPSMLPKQKEGETFIVSYEPKLEAKDEPWTQDDMAYRPNGLPQEFIKHEVELPEDWSEWVCPDPDEYFMKCCDCGLVHEVQYRVARYGEGDYCELVEDKDVQAQFRMRRRTPPQQEAKDEPVAWMVYTQDGQSVYVTDNPTDIQEGQRALPMYTTPQWVGLTDKELNLIGTQWHFNLLEAKDKADLFAFARAIEAKLKEKNCSL